MQQHPHEREQRHGLLNGAGDWQLDPSGASDARISRNRNRRNLFMGLVGAALVVGVVSATVVSRGESALSSSSSSGSSSADSAPALSTKRVKTASGGNVPLWNHVHAGSESSTGPASITGFGFGSDDSLPFQSNVASVAHKTATAQELLETSQHLTWSVKAMDYDDVDVSHYPWSRGTKGIIETGRTVTFTAADSKADASSLTYAYGWEITDPSGAVTKLRGDTAEFVASTTGWHEVALTATKRGGDYGDSSSTRAIADKVMSKYVRREVRDLTDDDRNRVLDAMQVVYKTEMAEGKKAYGARFKNIAYFLEKHLRGAGARECDHWHDDAGVVTHHVAFTLEFEQALQAVDPAVTMPYWDVTRDAMRQSTDGTLWRESEIFQDDWFGRSAGNDLLKAGGGNGDLDQTSTHVISKGRWAYTETPRVVIEKGATETETETETESSSSSSSSRRLSSVGSHVHNAYGLMRAPWNLNPTPYLTRSGTVSAVEMWSNLPTCAATEQCFYSTTLSTMNECLNGATHGPVHIMLGGIWQKKMSQYINDKDQAYLSLLMSKNLWRQGYVQCPSECGEEGVDSCTCSCPSIIGMSSLDVLLKSGVITDMVDVYVKSDMDHDNLDSRSYAVHGVDPTDEVATAAAFDELLHEQLCTLGHVGDMYTSGSPFDPTFWLIHGSMDRLLQWRRIQAASGDLPFDESWGFEHVVGPGRTASDTGIVCDWTGVESGDAERPTCAKAVCPGHKFDDALPFEDFLKETTATAAAADASADASPTASASSAASSYLSGYASDYTNSEFFKFISPLNEDLPYMYANFEWTHCDEASTSSSSSSSSSSTSSAGTLTLNSKFVGGLGTGMKARAMHAKGFGFGSGAFTRRQ